ncbi:MAG: YndJ family transporter [Planctomycetota bacterium]|nr:YndJ family transporter [Planctomycetota bacterium]
MNLSFALGILYLALLVITPLGIKVSFDSGLLGHSERQRYITWGLWLIGICGAEAGFFWNLAYGSPAGTTTGNSIPAIAGALCWNILTGWMFLVAAASLLRESTRRFQLLPIAGGWMLISVGAYWFGSLLLNHHPLGFDRRFVILTAVHFHFAGFALPVMTGRLIKHTEFSQPKLSRRLTVLSPLMLMSIPFVGIGIAYSPLVEVFASLILAGCCIVIAISQIYGATHLPTAPSWGLSLSSTSLILAAFLAAFYAIGEYSGNRILTIPVMIASHGTLNAVGFSLLGLVCWACLSAPAEKTRPENNTT